MPATIPPSQLPLSLTCNPNTQATLMAHRKPSKHRMTTSCSSQSFQGNAEGSQHGRPRGLEHRAHVFHARRAGENSLPSFAFIHQCFRRLFHHLPLLSVGGPALFLIVQSCTERHKSAVRTYVHVLYIGRGSVCNYVCMYVRV